MNIFSFGKHFLEKNTNLIKFISPMYNYIIGRNHFLIHGKENILNISHSFLKRTRINVIGNNNKIIFGEKCYLDNTFITIKGNNNCINLGNMVFIKNGDLYIEDDRNLITIGNKVLVCGYTHLACIEGKTITIGNDCLFSSDVILRVGDSHSILDSEGKRINHSQSIFIGDHVWFGNKTLLTKGVNIANDSIVGTGAIVTKKFTQSNVIIAGVPASIIKENINWDKERI